MIAIPSDVRVWLTVGYTDMRRGMNGLALQVQDSLKRDPHAGDLYGFRGKLGDLIKILWHDGIRLSLYAKRLDRGKFIWPTPRDGVVAISAAQLGYLDMSVQRARKGLAIYRTGSAPRKPGISKASKDAKG
jgi:transposase